MRTGTINAEKGTAKKKVEIVGEGERNMNRCIKGGGGEESSRLEALRTRREFKRE